MSLCFATYSAEEQIFQGSIEYVRQHCVAKPRLAINLDELSTRVNQRGSAGVWASARLGAGPVQCNGRRAKCHVMSQLDASSDHFPFVREGIDAAHLWRWRFSGRHADSDYHHEPADTADKLNVRELKEVRSGS